MEIVFKLIEFLKITKLEAILPLTYAYYGRTFASIYDI
jgi:hypothetical protein